MILNNKGMFLEEILNRWCEHINENDLGYVSKTSINHSIFEVKQNVIKSVIKNNNNCDYIGILNSRYIEFEAKESEKEYFNLNNIKKHQLEKLMKINDLNGIAFIIVYFHQFNSFYLLNIEQIKQLYTYKTKKIPITWFEEFGIELHLDGLILNILDNYLFV